MSNTRNHYIAVVDLLDCDPFSEVAQRLRAEIRRMEQRDPTLIAQRRDIMAAHSKPIGGEVPPAERVREGIMMR